MSGNQTVSGGLCVHVCECACNFQGSQVHLCFGTCQAAPGSTESPRERRPARSRPPGPHSALASARSTGGRSLFPVLGDTEDEKQGGLERPSDPPAICQRTVLAAAALTGVIGCLREAVPTGRRRRHPGQQRSKLVFDGQANYLQALAVPGNNMIPDEINWTLAL